jgi:hypothetical protein
MVLGAVGGVVAVNEVQKKYDAPKPGQKIIVPNVRNCVRHSSPLLTARQRRVSGARP